MFTSVGNRSANAYKKVGVETSVEGASPHRLVDMLFDALQQCLGSAKVTMQKRDIPAKVKYMGQAIRILEEGLKIALDMEKGGEIAANLNELYSYCIRRLVLANATNNVAVLDEVIDLVAKVADGWKKIDSRGPAYLQPV